MWLLFLTVFTDQLFRQLGVAGGTTAGGVVENGWQTVAWSLAQTNVAWDHGAEHHVAEVAFQLFVDLVGKAEACVVHGEQETLDLERWVEFRLDDAHGVEQLADALKCEILGLYRDNHRIGSCESVHGNQSE